MKSLFATIALTFAAFIGAAQADIPLASFGLGNFDCTSYSFATATQTATSYEFTGTDLNCSFFGNMPAAVNIAGNDNVLKLTATFSGAATSKFAIDLFDAAGNDRTYIGSFSAFTPGVEMTVILTLGITTGAFNDTQITGLQLLTSGHGDSVDLTMKTLTGSAVPEPTTYALFGAGALALFASARSRFKAKASLR